ncbi:NAD(P)H-quinone oxidoreductase subunit [Trichinella spiralis]|uniref:NAD(P)H-quinone oxidoreductase subunit n=1 Tax=Trichinella spiralis TaxID=6334 RepID=A0ABR3K4Q2_TRISP
MLVIILIARWHLTAVDGKAILLLSHVCHFQRAAPASSGKVRRRGNDYPSLCCSFRMDERCLVYWSIKSRRKISNLLRTQEALIRDVRRSKKILTQKSWTTRLRFDCFQFSPAEASSDVISFVY